MINTKRLIAVVIILDVIVGLLCYRYLMKRVETLTQAEQEQQTVQNEAAYTEPSTSELHMGQFTVRPHEYLKPETVNLYDVSDQNIVLKNKKGKIKINAYGIINGELLLVKLDFTNTDKKNEPSFRDFNFDYIDVYQDKKILYESLWYYDKAHTYVEYGSTLSDITFSYTLENTTSDVKLEIKRDMMDYFVINGKVADSYTFKLQ